MRSLCELGLLTGVIQWLGLDSDLLLMSVAMRCQLPSALFLIHHWVGILTFPPPANVPKVNKDWAMPSLYSVLKKNIDRGCLCSSDKTSYLAFCFLCIEKHQFRWLGGLRATQRRCVCIHQGKTGKPLAAITEALQPTPCSRNSNS